MKKRLFTLLVSSYAILFANAQVQIHDNGYISIQTPTTTIPQSPITINSTGSSDYYVYLKATQSGIYSRTTGNNSNWGNSAVFENYGTQNNFIVGVKGETRTPGWTDMNRGRTFGVMGLAGYATNGYNYGIFGRIHGNNNGAAIYGTCDEVENGVYIDGKYAGYFNGNARVTGTLKVNGAINGMVLTESVNPYSIQTFSETDESVSDKIKNINIISYYKPDQTTPSNLLINASDTAIAIPEPTFVELQDMSKKHYGISAEQLEEIYPDLVYEDENGNKSINYTEMIPLLLQSINELNTKIENLEEQNNQLKTRSTNISNTTDMSVVTISQNYPNPFSNTTSLQINIPETVNDAYIYIYDLSGKQIKQIKIADRGKTSITLSANDLNAGMYIYSLIVDNKFINSKRMIVTK